MAPGGRGGDGVRLGDRVLRAGSRGGDVRELQTLANGLGARLTVDGVFGPATTAWVRSFQSARDLTPDAVVGTLYRCRVAPGSRRPRRTPGGRRAPGRSGWAGSAMTSPSSTGSSGWAGAGR